MPKTVTFEEISFDYLLHLYLENRVLRPSSERNYRQITSAIQKDLRINYLQEATKKRILKWRKDVLERSSAITWNNYHTHMRALFNFAVEEHFLSENIFLQVGKVQAPKLKKKIINVESVGILLQTIQNHAEKFDPPFFWIAVFKTLFFTGMRQQQLLALKCKDIDFKKHQIFLALESSKTHREWVIPMSAACYDELWELRQRTLDLQGPVDITEHPVFHLQLFNANFSGFGLTRHQIEGFFKKLTKISGEPVSAHRLRHTMATLIAQSGDNPDLKSLQYILGHTDIRTTMGYIEPKKEHLTRVLDKLSLTIK